MPTTHAFPSPFTAGTSSFFSDGASTAVRARAHKKQKTTRFGGRSSLSTRSFSSLGSRISVFSMARFGSSVGFGRCFAAERPRSAEQQKSSGRNSGWRTPDRRRQPCHQPRVLPAFQKPQNNRGVQSIKIFPISNFKFGILEQRDRGVSCGWPAILPSLTKYLYIIWHVLIRSHRFSYWNVNLSVYNW